MALTIEDIATLCHQANKSYCELIGDNSQVEWTDAPEWQRESAIKGVQFHLDNTDATASASHNSWLEEKLNSGWQYGEVKDAEAKTHPCIVSFEELPLEQQAKDWLFRGIVHSISRFINY